MRRFVEFFGFPTTADLAIPVASTRSWIDSELRAVVRTKVIGQPVGAVRIPAGPAEAGETLELVAGL